MCSSDGCFDVTPKGKQLAASPPGAHSSHHYLRISPVLQPSRGTMTPAALERRNCRSLCRGH